MKRVCRLFQVGALVTVSGVVGCGDTTRSSNADAAAGGSSNAAAADGSGGGGSDAGSGETTSSPSGSGGSSGGSGGTAASGGDSSDNGGSGGSGAAGTVGTGGSAGNLGGLPEEQTPGAFDCGAAAVGSPLLRLTHVEYDNTIVDLLGVETLDEHDGVRPSAVLANDPLHSISELGWEAYRAVAAAIARQVMGGPLAPNFITCDPTAVGCLSDTVVAFGRRAFRRPLTQDEVADYESLIPDDPAELSEATAEMLLSTMLASPSFLFRPEQGGPSEPVLTSHELASRLAYFLWGGPPDAALSAAADADELRNEEQLEEQALRLLGDPRSRRSFAEFHRRYLRMDEVFYWGATDHDTDVYPLYTPEVNATALDELEAFLDDVVASQGSFQDLFLSEVGFVNRDTALLYGVSPDNLGSELVRVRFDPVQRPGLLTRLAFLSSFSSYSSTSPILRGVFVNNEILNLSVPTPAPDLGHEPTMPGVYATNRERVTQLTSPTGCQSCHHVYINPPGFVLEAYDAVGSWQPIDPFGGPIDPVADVFFGDEVATVRSPLELMQKLAASKFAQRNYADEVIAYAFARPSNARDACLGEALAASIAQGVSLQELWLELVLSDEFRVRGVPAD